MPLWAVSVEPQRSAQADRRVVLVALDTRTTMQALAVLAQAPSAEVVERVALRHHRGSDPRAVLVVTAPLKQVELVARVQMRPLRAMARTKPLSPDSELMARMRVAVVVLVEA